VRRVIPQEHTPQDVERLELATLDAEALGRETLQGADRHRLVEQAASAGSFARRPTDPATHRRQGVRATGDEVCLLEITGGNRPYVAARIGANGTCALTLDQTPEVLLVGDVDEVGHLTVG
jgi:hypothetical protein